MRLVLVALGLRQAQSSHTAAERECLARHAAGRESAVELGVEQGSGTALLRRALDPDGRLYAVDPHRRGRAGVSFPRLIARIEVARARSGRAQWLRTTADGAVARLAEREPRGVEFVFSDCVFDEAGLARLWNAWRERLAPGGIFIQSTSRPLPGRTTDEHETVRFTRDVLLYDPDFDLVEVIDTFTVLVRRSPVS